MSAASFRKSTIQVVSLDDTRVAQEVYILVGTHLAVGRPASRFPQPWRIYHVPTGYMVTRGGALLRDGKDRAVRMHAALDGDGIDISSDDPRAVVDAFQRSEAAMAIVREA